MRQKLILLAGVLFMYGALFAQDEDALKIFGYYQGSFQFNNGYTLQLPNSVKPALPTSLQMLLPASLQGPSITYNNKATNTFVLQQLNLFFTKDFKGNFGDFSSFVNLELTQNFSSAKNWGTFSLEEAWVKYSYSDAFNLKAGLLIPAFNNLNEIKNRTPILPYVCRPFVYEASMAELIPLSDYIPETASIQISGSGNLNENIKGEYAVYLGNSERSYINTQASGSKPTGFDTTMFKMVGARLGIRYRSLKAGVSGTYDRDNRSDIYGGSGISGDLVRLRIGIDGSFNIGRFFFESEFISVLYDLSAEQKNYIKNYNSIAIVPAYVALVRKNAILDSLNNIYSKVPLPAATRQLLLFSIQSKQMELQQDFLKVGSVSKTRILLGDDFNKLFFYATAGYNILDELAIYGTYSYLQDKIDVRFKDGFQMYNGGFVYKPVDAVAIKAQFSKLKLKDEYKMNTIFYYCGVSVFF